MFVVDAIEQMISAYCRRRERKLAFCTGENAFVVALFLSVCLCEASMVVN